MWNKDDPRYPIFRVIDPNTLKRAENGMDYLPSKNLNYPKDKAWNKKNINSMFLQGIMEGQAVQKIARNILPEINSKSGEGDLEKSVIKRNRQSAIRNARTMVTSAENGGRLASYKELDRMGIVQRKEWMATPDDRTRKSHIDIDGEERDINEKFSNGLMYPADPNGAADEVWMCRCSMADHVVGFRRADGKISKVEYQRDRTMHEDQMQAERDKRAAQTKAALAKKGIKESEDYATKIKAIVEDVEKNGLTEEKIMEAGQILADEVNADLKERQTTIDEAREKLMAAGESKIREIHDDPLRKQANGIHNDAAWLGKDRIDWAKYPNFTNFDEAHEYLAKGDSQMAAIRMTEEYKRAREEYSKALKLLNEPQKLADDLKEKLAKIRTMGSEGLDVKGHFYNSKSPVRKDFEWAYDKYPKSWVEKSLAKGNLKCGKVNRGYYSSWAGEIKTSGDWEDGRRTVCIHELGHRFENTLNDILKSEKHFYDRRTAGESLEWLGAPYAKSEKTRKDQFLDSYMGKDYHETAYELVSMGFQYAYTDPVQLAKDKDMQTWILGLLSIVP